MQPGLPGHYPDQERHLTCNSLDRSNTPTANIDDLIVSVLFARSVEIPNTSGGSRLETVFNLSPLAN